jgi:type IV pilus assembly protein PilX
MKTVNMTSIKHRTLGDSRQAKRRSTNRGIALVTALILLLVITLLGLTMTRGFTAQERNAGNTREKQRAFEAAESTLRFGEREILNGASTTASNCNSLVSADTTPQSVVVCSNALTSAQATGIPWKDISSGADLGYSYTPPGLSVGTTGGTSSYVITPRFYISPLGLDPSGLNQLYQVTSMAQGGNTSSNAVVQSVYSVTPNVIDGSAR